VVDAPEVVPDVRVEHVIVPLRAEIPQRLQGHRRAPFRAEAVRARAKARLEDRLQHQLRRHLDHPVPYRRDPKRPLLPIGLRDVPAQHRGRPILPCEDVAQLFEELHAVLFERRESLCIDPRGPLVPPHSLPRFREDVTPRDAVVQRVETTLRMPLGCVTQSILE